MEGFELYGTPLWTPALRSRAITAENPDGGAGLGGRTMNGRKGRPCLPNLEKGQCFTIAEIRGPGAIRHIWMTLARRSPAVLRNTILRFYWDGQAMPSVEAPISDFFGICHGAMRPFECAFLGMAEGRAFTSYFLMPFGRGATLTVTNEGDEDAGMLFYQVDYTIGDSVTDGTPRFHARFRRVPLTTIQRDYVVLDGVIGRGRYLGANIGIVDRYHGCDAWWGEGEVKVFLDDDTAYPTICGTGSEDYAGSGWGLGQFHARESGAPLVEGKYVSFYRFHGHDPIYFSRALKVTLQQMGS